MFIKGVMFVPNQFWIQDNDQCLMAVVHNPKSNYRGMVAVLVSGFANAMCDIDYFMSKVAHHLSAAGIYVIQVDPIGHGDSYGVLSDVTINTYQESLRSVFKYAQRELCENIVCVGRGISAAIQCELAKEFGIHKLVGITPYNICGSVVSEIWGSVSFDKKEISEVYQGKDYKKYTDFNQQKRCFFNALGGTILNLHGQCINGTFINELMEYSPCLGCNFQEGLWIWCNEVMRYSTTCLDIDTVDLLMKVYQSEGLPRNPECQDSVISHVVDYIIKE